MTRKLIVVALVAALASMILPSAPAQAWRQPFGAIRTFYAPGPPPGSFWAGCAVTTVTNNYPRETGGEAHIKGLWNAVSRCVAVCVRLILFNWTNGQLGAGPYSCVFMQGQSRTATSQFRHDVGNGTGHWRVLATQWQAYREGQSFPFQWATSPLG